MPNQDEILVVVQEVMFELFKYKPEEVQLDTHLYQDLDLDSLDAIDLAATLSKKAKIKLVEEEMKEIRTISDIVEIGHRKLN